MIAFGCDHGGIELKNEIIEYLKSRNIECNDFGCYDTASVDYPLYAKKVAQAVRSGECEFGILVCGTGIGMSLAANKFKGIRAAACSETFSAKMTRAHNNSNILCLGARVIGSGVAKEMVDLFLSTEYEGERHEPRVAMISDFEENGNG